MADDPFTQVYDKIRDTLTEHAGFAAICNSANLTDYSSSDPDPGKKHRHTADYPAWALVQTGGDFNPRATTTSSQFTLEMELLIESGDKLLDQVLFPAMWQALKALHTLKDGSAMGLAFDVTAVRLGTHDPEIDEERRQAGWLVAWVITVEFMLPHTYVEA